MTRTATIALAAMIIPTLSGAALAGQQELNFTLVTKRLTSTVHEIVHVPDQMLAMSTNFGVAVFEDGRIAEKEFVVQSDGTPAASQFIGYSTYTFTNGDSLTFRFTGGWGKDGVGGDYELLSATGAYEGATGTGRFDGIDAAWKDTDLYRGVFKLDVPES